MQFHSPESTWKETLLRESESHDLPLHINYKGNSTPLAFSLSLAFRGLLSCFCSSAPQRTSTASTVSHVIPFSFSLARGLFNSCKLPSRSTLSPSSPLPTEPVWLLSARSFRSRRDLQTATLNDAGTTGVWGVIPITKLEQLIPFNTLPSSTTTRIIFFNGNVFNFQYFFLKII